MNQAARFISIRVRQIIRELAATGPFYGLIIIAAAILFFYFIFNSVTTLQSILITYALLLAAIYSLHYNRSDRDFIEGNTEKPWLIYLTEYTIVLSVFIIIFIFNLKNLIPLLFYLPLLAVCRLKLRSQRKFFESISVIFIHPKNYEWLSGIRKTGWFILFLLIAALTLTPVMFAPMILLWFVLLVVSTFYEQHESLEMLESHEKSAGIFLMDKVMKHTKIIFLPFVIILGLSTVFHSDRWWIYLLFLVYSLLMIVVFIVTKYSMWGIPGNHKAGSITNSLCLIGFFIPFLLPVPLIILAINYKKSISKLEPILHDYHK